MSDLEYALKSFALIAIFFGALYVVHKIQTRQWRLKGV